MQGTDVGKHGVGGDELVGGDGFGTDGLGNDGVAGDVRFAATCLFDSGADCKPVVSPGLGGAFETIAGAV